MENGVEKYVPEEETKTADGAVSELKLVDKVVQVFHEKKDFEGDDVSEEETKTADGAVSQLKLVDNVVQVFHETKDSEGDDVFEEAIMDEEMHVEEEHQGKLDLGNGGETLRKEGDFDSFEVNGKLNDVHKVENFEEAVETELPSEDGSFEVEQPDVVEEKLETLGTLESEDEIGAADGVVNVKEVLPEELPDGVVCNGEGHVKEASAVIVDGETKQLAEGEVESSEACDAYAHEKSENGDEVKVVEGVVDDDDNVNDVLPEESSDGVVCNGEGDVKEASVVDNDDIVNDVLAEELSDGVVCNGEGDVKEASASFVNGETKPSTDAEVESSESCDAAVHEESENGDLKKLELEEKPVVPAISTDVDKVGPDEIEDDQSRSGSCGAAVHEKSENGVLEKLELEETPAVLAKSSDVDKVILPEGNKFSDNILSKDGQSCEMRDTGANVNTLVNEKMQIPKIETVTIDLGVSVDEGTEAREIKNPSNVDHWDTTIDKRVKADAVSEVKDSQNSQVHHTSVKIGESSNNHAVLNDPEVQETQGQHQKKETASIEESGRLSSAKEPEIQPAVEPVQAPPTPRRPAGLGGAAPLSEPAPRALQQPRVNGAAPQRQAQLVEDPMNGEAEENDETREKLQMIRVKFLRLAHRLGQTPHNVVVAQVLYRLGLAEQLRGRNAGRVGAFSFDRASAMAEQLESAGQEPLDFTCTIMVLGKTGVGKSATINSIFDEIKFSTDAFQMGTKKVQDVVGTVQGIKVRVIDTPGLLPCWSDQRQNEKILHSVKRFIKKTPPDIVLYLDRLDMQSRDFGDLPLLRTITEIFGPSIWFNAIVVLTHAASAPPDGPNGISSSYEMFVTQRSHVVQQAIRQAAGDMRLMNPVSLVENHSACRTNRAGQRVLPNGQVWKPHLLLLSFASKILAEANTLLKLQDNPPGKPFAARPRVPPLPFLLSSLLQSRPQVKLPEEQFGDEDDLDDDLDESSDSDEESEYDELPPFKRLTKAQLAKLSKAQKKAYFDELEYREKLFMKRQLREEKKRRKLLKKMAGSAKDLSNDYTENAEEENGGAASVPVALPDFTLPTSFDSDNPTHRYRFLDSSNQWLVRPVLESHGWDHDVGYEGINVERLFAVKDKIPVSFSGQVTKDKKECNLQLELASSVKHNEGKATSVGFDMQTMGKDMSYTLRSETRFCNFRHNKTAAGLSVTLLGDALTAGVKLEDRLIVNKRFRLVMTGGAMTGRGDVAYGGSLEATLRDKDYPLGRTLSTLGLSIMDWHGDLAIGCNVQSQIPIGRSTNLIARANLNNRGSGQVSIRLNSSEQLQIALVALVPIFRKISGYYQQMMYEE